VLVDAVSPVVKRKPRQAPRDELFEAVAEAFGHVITELTGTERGRLNKAVAELRQVGATPVQVRERARKARFKFETVSEMALVANWTRLAMNVRHKRECSWHHTDVLGQRDGCNCGADEVNESEADRVEREARWERRSREIEAERAASNEMFRQAAIKRGASGYPDVTGKWIELEAVAP